MTVSKKMFQGQTGVWSEVAAAGYKQIGNIVWIEDIALARIIDRHAPTLPMKIIHLAGALGRAGKAAVTGRTVKSVAYEDRLTICMGTKESRPCIFYRGGNCEHSNCGCSVKRKAILSTEVCPIGKW